LDFDKCADFGFGANLAAVEIHELRKFDVLAHFDARGDATVISAHIFLD
jgi:hypothetical protein